MKRTTARSSTWKGRPGTTYDLLVTTQRLGPRVNVHHWTDTNTVEVRAIRGDGRTPEFQEFSNETLQKPDLEDIANAEHRALQCLAKAKAVGYEKAALSWKEILAKVPEPETSHLPHAHITGPAVVVIYGEDMAEKIVGPFANGIDADLHICSRLDVPIGRPDEDWDARPRVDVWADVFPLTSPEAK